jgi:hypothetical protein
MPPQRLGLLGPQFDAYIAAVLLNMRVSDGEIRLPGDMQNRTLTLRGDGLGAVATGVEETMLESPILSQNIPPVVFLLPAAVTQSAQQHSGEGLRIPQGGIPEPFVLRARLALWQTYRL